MGLFSWKFADKNNKERLICGKKGYVLTPDGEFIETSHYDGYGHFSCHDIYELVVDWNKDFIRQQYKCYKEGERNVFSGKEDYFPYIFKHMDKMLELNLDDDAVDEYLQEVYGERIPEWKRDLGILIACHDEDNAAIAYPIKIVSSRNCGKYEEFPASKSDPMQGCY